jgi:alkylation response protein AidB-like acyl-CoA dehydrogenase
MTMPARPMDATRFGLSPHERAGFDAVREIVDRHRSLIGGPPLDRMTLQKLFKSLEPTGYLASTVSTVDGGSGLSPLAFGVLVEALAPEFTLLGNHSVQRYLAEFGSAALKAEHLPLLLDGNGIGAIAITEPHAGSDLSAMHTRAVRNGDRWQLDGSKTWVTHGMVATLFIVLAKTGDDATNAFTRFVVPADTPGLAVKPMSPIGLRHMSFAELSFDACDLPDARRLGDEGGGAEGSKSAFPLARLLATLQSLRIAQAALDIGAAYARERSILGSPLAKRELVLDGHTRRTTNIDALRLLAYSALATFDAPTTVRTASAVKAAAADASIDACQWATELSGSIGLDESHPIHTLARDAKMMCVVDGTSVLNRLVVGRRELR